jgi:hypothetical protein
MGTTQIVNGTALLTNGTTQDIPAGSCNSYWKPEKYSQINNGTHTFSKNSKSFLVLTSWVYFVTAVIRGRQTHAVSKLRLPFKLLRVFKWQLLFMISLLYYRGFRIASHRNLEVAQSFSMATAVGRPCAVPTATHNNKQKASF